MDGKWITDAFTRVDKLIDPATGIRLKTEDTRLPELAALLEKERLSRKRRIVILGGYLLLRAGLASHQELDRQSGEERTRSLLGGDYLFGVYLRWLVQNGEGALLAYLTPVHKTIQIHLAAGGTADEAEAELFAGFRSYLSRCQEEVFRTRRPQ